MLGMVNEYSNLLEESFNSIKTADHMLQVTYPLLQDAHLVMSVIEKMYGALTDAITALLKYEYTYKRLSYFPERIEERIVVFKEHAMSLYGFDRNILIMLKELKELSEFGKRSPLNVIKKNLFVVCSAGYSTKTIDVRKIKDFVNQSQIFIKKMQGIIGNGL